MIKFLIIGTFIIGIALVVYFYMSKHYKKSTKTKTTSVEGYKYSSSPMTVILCHANWCSHCQYVKEWFVDLVTNSPISNAKFEMIEEEQIPSQILNSIKGFPSIIIMTNNQMQVYPGNRTKEDLITYLENI